MQTRGGEIHADFFQRVYRLDSGGGCATKPSTDVCFVCQDVLSREAAVYPGRESRLPNDNADLTDWSAHLFRETTPSPQEEWREAAASPPSGASKPESYITP